MLPLSSFAFKYSRETNIYLSNNLQIFLHFSSIFFSTYIRLENAHYNFSMLLIESLESKNNTFFHSVPRTTNNFWF